jgi:hypothetical protein
MDDRAHERLPVDKTIQCIVGQKSRPVFLYDISQGGCMFVTPYADMNVNDRVLMKVKDLFEVTGTTVWIIDGNAGLKFDRPLHEIYVRHLGFTPRSDSFDDWQPHDKFGRPLPELQPFRSPGDEVGVSDCRQF